MKVDWTLFLNDDFLGQTTPDNKFTSAVWGFVSETKTTHTLHWAIPWLYVISWKREKKSLSFRKMLQCSGGCLKVNVVILIIQICLHVWNIYIRIAIYLLIIAHYTTVLIQWLVKTPLRKYDFTIVKELALYYFIWIFLMSYLNIFSKLFEWNILRMLPCFTQWSGKILLTNQYSLFSCRECSVITSCELII